LQIPAEKQCLENRFVFKNKRFMSKKTVVAGGANRDLVTVGLDMRINPCYFVLDTITVSHRKLPTSATIKMVLMFLMPKISILKFNNLCASQLFYHT